VKGNPNSFPFFVFAPLIAFLLRFFFLFVFYGLAVKTGSIALQKFILFSFFLFFLVFAEKSLFFGVLFFSPDSSKKTNGPYFLIFSQVLE